MTHYWVHAFNSTSSLLGGAVVAGEADNGSIYYNPATISQMEDGSNFSFAANLFTWNFYTFKNAAGDGIDLKSNNFLVQPQFFSYTYKPPIANVSIAVAIMTRLKEKVEFSYLNSTFHDVIKDLPGDEKYNTTMHYRNEYNDTWIGAAFSHEISDHFSYGVSLFASFPTLIYQYNYSATTYHTVDIPSGGNDSLASIVSEGSYSESVRFTDYRLVLKMGFAYNTKNWRFGLNMTTPTWRIFSSGKEASRIDQRSNIFVDGRKLPDYIIFDGQTGNTLSTDYKLPFSVSFGFIYNLPRKEQKLYFTAEYFAKIEPYAMVNAPVNPTITSPEVYEQLENKDWLSFVYESKSLINVSVGYSWKIGENLTFLNALRTDFSSVNNNHLSNYEGYNYVKAGDYNIYHYSGGVEFTVFNSKFIAGTDFAFGMAKNQKQMANFSDPVEYDPIDHRALQGPLLNTMNTFYFGFGIFIGATLNFMKKPEKAEK